MKHFMKISCGNKASSQLEGSHSLFFRACGAESI
jgi:hypothetical protein